MRACAVAMGRADDARRRLNPALPDGEQMDRIHRRGGSRVSWKELAETEGFEPSIQFSRITP